MCVRVGVLYVITKFSRMDSLPNFLTHGAPLRARGSSAIMTSGAQWTDESDTDVSFSITKIDDLPPNKGNFHDYNHKVIYMNIFKNCQGQYKYKMGINFYRLTANTDYTLCLEILNTDYILWNNTQVLTKELQEDYQLEI